VYPFSPSPSAVVSDKESFILQPSQMSTAIPASAWSYSFRDELIDLLYTGDFGIYPGEILPLIEAAFGDKPASEFINDFEKWLDSRQYSKSDISVRTVKKYIASQKK